MIGLFAARAVRAIHTAVGAPLALAAEVVGALMDFLDSDARAAA